MSKILRYSALILLAAQAHGVEERPLVQNSVSDFFTNLDFWDVVDEINPLRILASLIPKKKEDKSAAGSTTESSASSAASGFISLVAEDLACPVCKVGVWSSQLFFNFFWNSYFIGEYGVVACYVLAPWAGISGSHCNAIVDRQFRAEIMPVIIDGVFDQQTLCTFLLELCDMDKWQAIEVKDWVQDLVSTKPANTRANDFVNNLYKQMAKSPTRRSDLVKIVMFSDLHVDYDYATGKSNTCTDQTCCRKDSGEPKDDSQKAGRWGDFKCDLPPATMQNMLDYIKTEIKPQHVFWGGNSVPHNLDRGSEEGNVEIMDKVTTAIFSTLKDIGNKDHQQFYFTIGNHDSFPENSFKASKPGSNTVLKQWSSKYIDPQEFPHFSDFGYYSANLDLDPKNKTQTKVISLNTNFCYQFNWETLNQFQDPAGMLDWLQNELFALEREGGAAIIISHIPNIDECNRQFGKRLHAILDRYQHVVRWGMASHTHREQFNVQKDVINQMPIGMNFIIGSASPYMGSLSSAPQGKNPSFSVAYIDPETSLPVDIESYGFDLTLANGSGNSPVWHKTHSWREEYSLDDLSPQSFFNFASEIHRNETAAALYKNHMTAGHGDKKEPCGYECRMWLFCQATANDYDEYQFCSDNNKFDIWGWSAVLTVEDLVEHNWYQEK